MIFKNHKSNLIFDIGAHTGEDTEFYLNKGFNVIAIEANPELTKKLKIRFANEIKNSNLVIVQRALVENKIEEISIFLNDFKDSWSSLNKEFAEKRVHQVREILVPTITIAELFKEFGVPYYLKSDIELSDIFVARSLLKCKKIPLYSSFELDNLEMIEVLYNAGYRKFQIRNQMLNGLMEKPNPTKEGIDFWPSAMDGLHSGIFGLDLPPGDWKNYSEIVDIYNSYLRIVTLNELKDSWFDIHATK